MLSRDQILEIYMRISDSYDDYKEKLITSTAKPQHLWSYDRHSIQPAQLIVDVIIQCIFQSRKLKSLAFVNFGTSPDIILSDIFLNSLKKNYMNDYDLATTDQFTSDKKYDLIFSLCPFGYRSLREEISKHIITFNNLSENGYGVFLFASHINAEITREKLRDKNLYINAIIRMPSASFISTGVKINLYIVSKVAPEKEFILKLTDINDLVEGIFTYLNNNVTQTLETGIFIKNDEFESFEKFTSNLELQKLVGDYTSYKTVPISEICTEVNLTKILNGERVHRHKKDCVYIPLIGTSDAETDFKSLRIKHQNYIQIVTDTSQILPKYLANFLNSQMGRILLKGIKESKGIIPRMTKSDIMDLKIAIPSITEQRNIVNNLDKLITIATKISEYTVNISRNPSSDIETIEKIESMLSIVGELSEQDTIRSIIRRGEDSKTEYKETLCLDVKKQTKEKYIQESIMKTIAAFLNTKGGDLLIGISDNRGLTGLEDEIKKLFGNNKDKFLNSFKDLVKSNIGGNFYPYIEHKMVTIEGKSILWIQCKASTEAVFIGEDFFVRTNPATDRLTGRRLVKYIQNRFAEN